MKKIKLGGKRGEGKSALVDDWNFDKLSKYSWHTNRAYAATAIKINAKWKYIYMHRMLLGAKENEQVDHINGNELDNRVCNLRKCTPAENMANSSTPKNNTSGYKGVCKSGKNWASSLTQNYKRYYLGTFRTKEAAAIAYNEKAREIFGEFARLNEING